MSILDRPAVIFVNCTSPDQFGEIVVSYWLFPGKFLSPAGFAPCTPCTPHCPPRILLAAARKISNQSNLWHVNVIGFGGGEWF